MAAFLKTTIGAKPVFCEALKRVVGWAVSGWFALLLQFSPVAVANDVYLTQQQFLDVAFQPNEESQADPVAKTLWLTGNVKADLQ